MFWSALAVEQTKLLKRKILWVEVGILVAAALFLLAGSYFVAGDDPDMIRQVTWPEAPSVLIGQFTAMSALFVVILIASVVAQEYGWRTLHLLLSRGVPRLSLLGAKFAAAAVPILLILIAPLLIGVLATGLFTYLRQGAVDAGQVEFLRLIAGVLAGAYTLLPYAAGAFALAIISRSTVTAIGGGVAFVLVESIGLQLMHEMGGLAAQAGQLFPAMLMGSLLRAVVQGETSPVETEGRITQVFMDPLAAVAAVAAITALFLGIAAVSFRRQDLTG